MTKTSDDLFTSIHKGLCEAVEISLENCEYELAIKYASIAEDIEMNKSLFVESKNGTVREYLHG